VRTTTQNPPGTNRGSYVFRDSSDRDLTILSSELPAVGREYTVTGRVEHVTMDNPVPVLRETARRGGIQTDTRATTARPAVTPPPVAATQPAPAVATPPPAAAPPPIADAQTSQSWPLVYALLGVVALLSLVMIVAFWPRRASGSSRPEIHIVPIAMQTPMQSPPSAPVGRIQAGQPTRPVLPRGPHTDVVASVLIEPQAELQVMSGPDAGKRFPLNKTRMTIGRSGSRQNDVMLSDDTVSREHAQIVYSQDENAFHVLNESTTNAVLVNSAPKERAVLQDGDVIQLGGSSLQFTRR
jgi:predicted component of type VI protein secretion system